MATIAIPLFRSNTAIGIVGPMDVFTQICGVLPMLELAPAHYRPIEIRLVGLNRGSVRYDNGVLLEPHDTVTDSPIPDIVLAPPIDHDVGRSIQENYAFIPWLQRCGSAGSILTSPCTGSFMLAEAGLLDGRAATTHWFLTDEFHRRYPAVRLKGDRILVEDGSVITAGGATSFLNLCLYIVEKQYGPEAAVAASKVMLVDIDKTSQLPYSFFRAAPQQHDDKIARVQEFLGRSYGRTVTLNEMAELAGMSARNFLRRFKQTTGISPNGYLQKVRIESAKHMLEQSRLSVDEIRHKVGYEDARSFRRLFKRHTGLTPTDFRAKFKPVNPGR
ncbi:MAG: GlxA family transcriptional regulator [Alphaproteobacteria bacterium]